MYKNMINKTYPFLSIIAIQLGQVIEHSQNVVNIFIFLLQLLIAILTITKLWHEIKIHKENKSEQQIEEEVKKEKPFLFGLLTLLKNFRK
jgi:hypothetical protein